MILAGVIPLPGVTVAWQSTALPTSRPNHTTWQVHPHVRPIVQSLQLRLLWRRIRGGLTIRRRVGYASVCAVASVSGGSGARAFAPNVLIDRPCPGSYDTHAVSVNANARMIKSAVASAQTIENADANEGSPPIVPAMPTALLGPHFPRTPHSRVVPKRRPGKNHVPRARNGGTATYFYRFAHFFLFYSLFSIFSFFALRTARDHCEMFRIIARKRIPLLICKKH